MLNDICIMIDGDVNNTLKLMNWKSQIEYIIDKSDALSTDEMLKLISDYEHRNKSKYSQDYKRYMLSYLKHVNIHQAIMLYESMDDESKLNMIHVIKIDFPHLSEIIEIYEAVCEFTENVTLVPESLIFS